VFLIASGFKFGVNARGFSNMGFLKYGEDFSIEPLRKRCHGHKEMVKHRYAREVLMEPPRQFKNCPEIREYWALRKRTQRAKTKEAIKE
jgi:hypothetical protein